MPTLNNGIDTGLVKQYNANVEILSQQKGSKLRNAVRLKTDVVGEDTFMDQIGKTTAVKRTTRNSDTPIVNTQWARRKIAMVDYDWADLIDKHDKLKMLADPASEYVINGAFALGRAMDSEIIDKAFSTAKTGKDGSTNTSFPTSTNQITVGASGLSVSKLLDGKRILDNNDVDEDEPRFMAITGNQLSDLLREDKTTNADFAQIKALVKGEINTFCGFEFIRISTSLLLKTGNNRRAICWAQNGLGLAIAKDITTDIDIRKDKNMAIQVYATIGLGATRLDEDKVVEILCQES